MRPLLVATHNPGKAREYRELLGELPLTVRYLDEAGIDLAVAETGATLTENAIIKATAYAQMSGMWTWADDSGLEVDALEGAPGVHSARFAGPDASDADRYHKLLRLLTGVAWDLRTARFRCVVALASPDGVLGTTAGAIEGTIAFGPSGENGFGYDPVFYIAELGRTMAQLPVEVKNRVSHRAIASRHAARLLSALLTGTDGAGHCSEAEPG